MHLSGRSRHFCYPVSSCPAYVTSILYELSDTFRFEVGDETRPRDRKGTTHLYSTACNNSTFRVCVVCCLCCVLFVLCAVCVVCCLCCVLFVLCVVCVVCCLCCVLFVLCAVCVVCCLCCVLFAYDHAAVISRVRAITLPYAGPNTATQLLLAYYIRQNKRT